MVAKYNLQYDKLHETFNEQVKLDFSRLCKDISQQHLLQVAQAVRDVIIDLFSERGVELTNMIFARSRINTIQATNLFRTISHRSKDIHSVQVRYKFISYITDMISNPTPLQGNALEYYSKAFVSIQALQIDPDGHEFKRRFLQHRTLIIDSNVLIPLLAKHSANQNIFEQVILSARGNNIQLLTLESILDEVRSHADWAVDLVKKHGEQSEDVLSAALGRPPYKRNAFLDSFIRYSADVKHIDFGNYIQNLFGGKLSNNDYLQIKLEKEFGIKLFDIKQIVEHQDDFYFVRDKIDSFVKQKADEAEIEKSDLRRKCESEVYALIKFWNSLRPDNVAEDEWACSFLCQGGFLNRIARESEFPIEANIVIRIDALYEFLLRFGHAKRMDISFKDVMLSSYFRATDYFVDKTKYQKFFSSLINEAERIYEDGMENFKKYVNTNLMTDSIDEFSDLEKPVFVAGLMEELKKKIEIHEKINEALKQRARINEERLAHTESELQKYTTKEINMKKFADKQRKAQKRRNK